MNILSNDRSNRLAEYIKKPLLFTELRNSTCCAEGEFSGICFHERELTQYMYCCDNIVYVDSNWGHHVLPGYNGLAKPKKTNRGRKKKQKVKKERKTQGDGTNFNSCIQITVLGKVERQKPPRPDKHSFRSVSISNTHEQFYKEYKFKVFRTGTFQVPGVLTEDMSDMMPSLGHLCEYLGKFFYDVPDVLNVFSVMRNYMFNLITGKIDIRRLHLYCNRRFIHLTNVNMKDIESFLVRPVFTDLSDQPIDIGWLNYIDSNIDSDYHINTVELINFITESTGNKNIYVNLDNLITWIHDLKLETEYRKFIDFANVMINCGTIFTEKMAARTLRIFLSKKIMELNKRITKHPDNDMSDIKYDQDKYPGFLIYVKTPIPCNLNKRTTVKIFPSGKINIDGANDIAEATFIYWWLNDLLLSDRRLVYNDGDMCDSSDDLSY